MTDYAAAPVQPIASALLTIDAAGNPQVTGRGFSAVTRSVPASLGDFLLTMDEGIGAADIGSGPDFTVGVIGPNGLDPACVRVGLTMRGGTTAPGVTTISARSVTITSTPGEGATQIRVTLRNTGNALTDPMGPGAPNADGSGLEIMLWNGCPTPDDAQAQLVGPLFQGAMQFP